MFNYFLNSLELYLLFNQYWMEMLQYPIDMQEVRALRVQINLLKDDIKELKREVNGECL